MELLAVFLPLLGFLIGVGSANRCPGFKVTTPSLR